MPLVATRGAASAQGFGEFAQSGPANYIEDVFSTWLYTGNGSTQTITNGIDLSGKGGLVWIKSRTSNQQAWNHSLMDTVRGNASRLYSNLSGAANSSSTPNGFSYNSNGFTVGTSDGTVNSNVGYTENYASWTFREQPKFFDIVTYTGDGANTRNIAHNLGSVPGFIVVKRTDSTGNWYCWHRNYTGAGLYLNEITLYPGDSQGIATSQSSTELALGPSGQFTTNNNGSTYVAYLFAHNAGGFGASGSDNVISCGLFTTDANSRATVTLGYEPQFFIFKSTSSSEVSSWEIDDIMRGWGETQRISLYAQSSNAENTNAQVTYPVKPTSTGFIFDLSAAGGSLYANRPYIYIAIRRGPMRTPTSGTSVFSPIISSTYDAVNTTGFPVDAQIWAIRGGAVRNSLVVDRLRGVGTDGSTNDGVFLSTALTDAELGTGSNTSRSWNNTGFRTPGYSGSVPEVFWSFRRAPSFFDVVCYTGTGVGATAYSHNLTTTPDFVLYKRRDSTGDWACLAKKANNNYQALTLNTTDNGFQIGDAVSCGLSNTTFKPADYSGNFNISTATYVAYLFATCAGVSKVGSYTGTGALQTVNCGFTGGARFVLIKRTDSTGDWYTYDSARGISSSSDPYLLLNSTAAEVTGTNYVDTTSVGFQVTAAAPAGLNANGGTYIFLAIA
jgi:hypothetical protein